MKMELINTHQSKKFNRRKYLIFRLMSNYNCSITADDLISNLHITPDNAWKRLSKMHLQGYLIRTKRGHYKLGAKGTRVLEQLQRLKNIEKATGKELSFNLKKHVPFSVLTEYKKSTCDPHLLVQN